MLAPLDSDELDLRSNEVDVRRQQPQAGHDGRPDRLLGRLPAQDDVIDRGMEAGLLDTEAGRRVALRVEVDEKSWALGESKPGREIDGGGRLSDAALLVHDRDGPGHLNQSPARLNVPRRTLSNQHVFTLGAVFHGQHFPQSGVWSQTFRKFQPRETTSRPCSISDARSSGRFGLPIYRKQPSRTGPDPRERDPLGNRNRPGLGGTRCDDNSTLG